MGIGDWPARDAPSLLIRMQGGRCPPCGLRFGPPTEHGVRGIQHIGTCLRRTEPRETGMGKDLATSRHAQFAGLLHHKGLEAEVEIDADRGEAMGLGLEIGPVMRLGEAFHYARDEAFPSRRPWNSGLTETQWTWPQRSPRKSGLRQAVALPTASAPVASFHNKETAVGQFV